MQKWMLVFILAIFALMGAEEEEPMQNSDLTNFGGIPSCMTEYSVQAITGVYIDCEEDLSVVGPEPLRLIRGYLSVDKKSGELGVGWNHNLHGIVERHYNKGKHIFQHQGPLGETKTYRGKPPSSDSTLKDYLLDFDLLKGFSHATIPELSGPRFPEIVTSFLFRLPQTSNK